MWLGSRGWDKSVIGLLASVFSIASLMVRPVAGVATDRSGPPRLLSLSTLAFLLVPLIFGVGRSFWVLAAGQLIAGCCVGTFTVASNGFVTAVAPAERMSEAVAWFSIAFISAKGFGPALGTWLYERMGFHGTLWAVAAVTLICLGFLRIACAPGGESSGGRTLPGAAGAVKGGAERTYLNYGVVFLAAIILVSITISFGATTTFLPMMAEERGILGYRGFFLTNTMTVVIVRTFSGRALNRFGAFWVILVALSLLAVSVGMLAVVNSTAGLIVAAVLYGIGYGVSYPSLTATVVSATPAPSRGKAFGIYTAAQDLGLALGQACAGLSQYTSFKTIYLVMSVLPALGMALVPRLVRGSCNGDRGKEVSLDQGSSG